MKQLANFLWVGLGGFFGAMCRYGVARLSAALLGSSFPYGTFLINMSGSFLLGLVATLATQRVVSFGEHLRLVVAIGFIGAYTTYSTFEFESHALFEDGKWLYALTNMFASLFLGLLAVRFGIILAAKFSLGRT